MVLRRTLAILVQDAEVVLGAGVALVGKRMEQMECCRVVAFAGSSDRILERVRRGRASRTHAQDQQQLQQAHGVSPRAAPFQGGT